MNKSSNFIILGVAASVFMVGCLTTSFDHDPDLVYACSFDDTEAIVSPVVGPAGEVKGGTFVEGVRGQALHVSRGELGSLVRFEPGTFSAAGCIEFWAKIDEGRLNYGAGGNPSFFQLNFNDGGMFSAEFNGNNGGGGSGLSIRGPHITSTTDSRGYRDLGPMPFGWHHYAIVWDVKGVNGVVDPEYDEPLVLTLFIDGVQRYVRRQERKHYLEPRVMAERPSELGIPFDMTSPHKNPTKVGFAIDELKIWKIAKTSFD